MASNTTRCFSASRVRGQARAFGWYGHILPIGFQCAVGNIGSLVAPLTGPAQRISVPISRGRPPTC